MKTNPTILRRQFIKKSIFLGTAFTLTPYTYSSSGNTGVIMTVLGPIDPGETGNILAHEHILVDFIGAKETGYHRWDREVVTNAIAPYIDEVKKFGCKTIFECSPEYIGRDPLLLKLVSERMQINLITNSGLYGAHDNKFIPEYAYEESAKQLSKRWIKEWEDGIENTGIKPGFIKIGVNPGALSDLHKKLVIAAALTHKKTGLTIVAHTGPASTAFEELELLKREGVKPDSFIWVHAQSEKDLDKHLEAASTGAWVSLDGVNTRNIDNYVRMITNLRDNGGFHRTLVSHDAGWYSPGEPDGGDFRGFGTVFNKLCPALLNSGFTLNEIDQLLKTNPREAMIVRKRLI
ncbi:phosphotriesterase [Bacteroidota bacterium]